MKNEHEYLKPENVPYQLYLSADGKHVLLRYSWDDVMRLRNRGPLPDWIFVKENVRQNEQNK